MYYKERYIEQDESLCSSGYKLFQKEFDIDELMNFEPLCYSSKGNYLNNCLPTAFAVMGMGDRLKLQKDAFNVEKDGAFLDGYIKTLIGEETLYSYINLRNSDNSIDTRNLIKLLKNNLEEGNKTIVNFNGSKIGHASIFINIGGFISLFEGQTNENILEGQLQRYIESTDWDTATLFCVKIEGSQESDLVYDGNYSDLLPGIRLPGFENIQYLIETPEINQEENRLYRYLNYIIVNETKKIKEPNIRQGFEINIGHGPDQNTNANIIDYETVNFNNLRYVNMGEKVFVYNRKAGANYDRYIKSIVNKQELTSMESAFMDHLMGYQCKYKNGVIIEDVEQVTVEYYIKIIKNEIKTNLILFKFTCNRDMFIQEKLNTLLDQINSIFHQNDIFITAMKKMITFAAAKTRRKSKNRKKSHKSHRKVVRNI